MLKQFESVQIIRGIIGKCDVDLLSGYYENQSLTYFLLISTRNFSYLNLLASLNSRLLNQPIQLDSDDTFLSFATKSSITPVIQRLIELGADVNLGSPESALTTAQNSSNDEIRGLFASKANANFLTKK